MSLLSLKSRTQTCCFSNNNNTPVSFQGVQHLSPATDFYKKLALDCSGQQIGVDLFMLSSQYADLASLCKNTQHLNLCVQICCHKSFAGLGNVCQFVCPPVMNTK